MNLFGPTYCLDENDRPRPCDYPSWAACFDDRRNVVGLEHVEWVGTIITRFVGLDHVDDLEARRKNPNSVPLLLWCTELINSHNIYEARYATREEATRGHKRLVRHWRRRKNVSGNVVGATAAGAGAIG
jgi:hypothetical protein